MFKNFISKASELGKKAQNMASGYLVKPDLNMPDRRTEKQIETDEKIKEIFREIQGLKEICHDEYERKLTEITIEKDKLKVINTAFQTKFDELENKLKETVQDHEEYKRINETNSKTTEKLQKDLEDKIQGLNMKHAEFQEEKFKQTIMEECQKIEEKHNNLIESLKSISIDDIMRELKSNVNNSAETRIFSILDAKSKENEINVNSMNENQKCIENDNTSNYYKELEAKLSETINNLVFETLEKNTKISIEKSVNLISEIKEFLIQELNNIKTTLDAYSQDSAIIKKTNNELQENYIKEFSKYEEETRRSEKIINAKIKVEEDLKQRELLLQEKQVNLKELELKILFLEEEKKNLNLSIETLKINFKSSDNLCNDLCEKIKNLETNQKELTKSLEAKNNKFETSKQIVKNILTLYLEEEYFIDLIEKCIKGQEINTDETLKTSKVIKINLVVKLYKYIFNEILKPKLSKYKAFERLFSEVNSINYEFKSLDNFYAFSERLLTDENNLLNKFVVELLDIYETQSKSILDLKEKLKKSKEIVDDSKKNDLETKELLSKQISKLQIDCKEYAKLEKTLRENIESLENCLKDEKSEVTKLNTRLKALKQGNDNIEKDYSSLKESHDNLSQKIELYKLENRELIEKYKDKTNELMNEKDNNETLLSEKKELLNQVAEMDKLKFKINEKNERINSKEIEINKLKYSYQSLEEIFENLKDQQEKEKEDLKQQLLDTMEKKDEYELTINTLQEKHNHNHQSNQVINELNDRILFLEAENTKLREQKLEIKKHAEEVLVKVRNDLKDTEFLIDKRIISSFLFKYLDKNNNDKIKLAVMDTLSNFLGFSNEERKKVGLNPSTGNHYNTSTTDKLKDISDDLYNFILNA